MSQYLRSGTFGDKSTVKLQCNPGAVPVVRKSIVVAAELVEPRRLEEEEVLGAPLPFEVSVV